jgi:hypothetical protein
MPPPNVIGTPTTALQSWSSWLSWPLRVNLAEPLFPVKLTPFRGEELRPNVVVLGSGSRPH